MYNQSEFNSPFQFFHSDCTSTFLAFHREPLRFLQLSFESFLGLWELQRGLSAEPLKAAGFLPEYRSCVRTPILLVLLVRQSALEAFFTSGPTELFQYYKARSPRTGQKWPGSHTHMNAKRGAYEFTCQNFSEDQQSCPVISAQSRWQMCAQRQLYLPHRQRVSDITGLPLVAHVHR